MPDIPVHLAPPPPSRPTIPRVDGLAPARFAVKARSESATPALAAALAQALAAYTPIVRPCSASRDILVAILPSRFWRQSRRGSKRLRATRCDGSRGRRADCRPERTPSPIPPSPVEDAGNIVGWLGPDPARRTSSGGRSTR
jgi:hypothetical protein